VTRVAIALALAIAAVAAVAARAPSLPCSDLCSYYSAGLLARQGTPEAAYDAADLETRHREVHDLGLRAGPFLYSPVWLIPSAILAGEPLPRAISAGRIAGELALVVGLFAVLLALDSFAVKVLVAAAFALSHTAWVQLIYGNWSFALFALLAVAALALKRNLKGAETLAAALAIHLKPFVLFALLPPALARRRFAAQVALVTLVLGALVLPFTGLDSWKRFGSFLMERGSAGVTPFYSKSSLAANLARLETEPREWVAPRTPAATIPVRAAFWLGLPLLFFGARRLRVQPNAAFAFGIAWMLLFVPQIWEHTEIVLFAALPALARRYQVGLALALAATVFYNAWQQRLLATALLDGGRTLPITVLLWLYPAIQLYVLLAAFATAQLPRTGAEAEAVPALA
jgi:hypothetical protein